LLIVFQYNSKKNNNNKKNNNHYIETPQPHKSDPLINNNDHNNNINNKNNNKNNNNNNSDALFPSAPSHTVYNGSANEDNNHSFINSVLVLNIEKVVCWQIDSANNGRKIVGDGKYPLKVYQIESGLELIMYPEMNMIVNYDTPCLELTSRHYIFSISSPVANHMFAFVFDSNMPEIYLTLFENLLIPHCNFRRTEKEVQTVKLNHLVVEEPEDGIKVEINDEITMENKERSIEVEGSGKGQIIPFEENKSVITKENLDIVAEKVEIGGKILTHGILQGGNYLQEGIQYYGNKIRDQVDSGNVEVPDILKNSMTYAREVTPIVSTLSGVVTGTVSGVASKIGTYIGTAAYNAATSSSGEGESDPDSFMGKLKSAVNDPRTQASINIGKHGVNAIINVFDALEEAGLGILGATGSATSVVVEKRFGHDMAEMVADGVAITTDVIKTTSNIKSLGAKALLKRNAISAAKSSAATILAQANGEPAVPLLTEANPSSIEERDIGDDELEMFAQMETLGENGFASPEDSTSVSSSLISDHVRLPISEGSPKIEKKLL
jgi:hypothetical protein